MTTSLRQLLESTGTVFSVGEFARGAVLFNQGDACDDVWCIETGRISLAVTSPDGHEAISGLVSAGGLVADCLRAGQHEFVHSATAIEPTVILRVSRDRMMAALHAQPAVLDCVLGHLLAQQQHLEDALVQQILYPGEERLAHTLLSLAESSGPAGRCALPHLSQELMAEMVGTTRSRVSFFMNRFKKIGFIEARGGEIYVHPALLPRALQHDDRSIHA